MNISFVCNPETGGRGCPTHARHCRCDRPWLFELESCSRCGRWTQWTVRKTWHVQAQLHARRERLVRRPVDVSPQLAGVAL